MHTLASTLVLCNSMHIMHNIHTSRVCIKLHTHVLITISMICVRSRSGTLFAANVFSDERRTGDGGVGVGECPSHTRGYVS